MTVKYPRMSVYAIFGAGVSPLNFKGLMRGDSYDKLEFVRRRVGEDFSVVFLNEASCLDLFLLVCYIFILCQIKNSKKPFGFFCVYDGRF